MRKFLLIKSTLLLFVISANAQTTLFTQDFDAGGVYTDYVAASSPTIGQFNIINQSANAAVTMTNNTMKLTKSIAGPSSSNPFYAVRNSDLTTGNTEFVKYQFDYNISSFNYSNSTSSANLHLLVGSSITNDAVASQYHSKVTINHSTTSPYPWNILGNTTGNTYSGNQTITLIVNNSGATRSYIDPSGSTSTVADDTYDIWVGTTLEVNDLAALNTGDNLSKFKFAEPANTFAGTWDIDNIVVTALPLTLPITLTSFTGTAADKSVLLNWKTASEENNDYFDIQHSTDGKTFTSIGKVTGAGTSTSENSYSFKDENPFAGTNYYKLVQHDFDGATSSSKVVAVNSNIAAAALSVYAAPSDLKITLSSPNKTEGTLEVFDIGGRKLASTSIAVNKGYNQLSVPVSLQPGVHFVRYTADGETFTQKFMK